MTSPQSLLRYSTVHVLLAEEDESASLRIRQMLSESTGTSFRVTRVRRFEDALRLIDSSDIEVMLMNPALQDGGGLEAVGRIRDRAPEVPIVVITNHEDETLGLRAVQCGASGYLVRDEVSPSLLARSLLHSIERHRISLELNTARERQRHLVTHDHLTGLANRVLFQDRLSQALASAQRTGERLAVLFLDIDRFKTINESLGHAIGDQFLRAVARRLVGCLRKSDTIARVGGDEFAILLRNLTSELDSARLAEKLLGTLSDAILLRGRRYFTSASIGIAVYPNDGWDPGDLVKSADTAMYHAKERGRNRFEFFTADMNTQAVKRLTLEHQLRTALERGELLLQYQPQVDVEREKIVSAEALIRWRHPEMGMVSPADFLPLAEETGMIIPIGEWVLRAACRQNRIWRETWPELRVAVNASSLQFRELGFANVVRAALEESGLPPDSLEIEITESGLVEDAEATMNTLHELKRLGIHLSVDDFGTGYSALAYLKRLPVDALKIDKSFVAGVTEDQADATIASTIIAIARGLGLECIAEGVETREQMEFLGSHGCTQMQGWLFSAALAVDSFETRLREPVFPWKEEQAQGEPAG
jgi:diguanylate cyclase (GGDEF)-like protein